MPRPRGPARDQLLEAAQHLLLERGYEATALDEVCATAQVTKGGLFHHFGSKEQLAAAAVERFYGQLLDKGRHAMGAAPTDPTQLLWRYLDAVVALLQDPVLSRGCLLGYLSEKTVKHHLSNIFTSSVSPTARPLPARLRASLRAEDREEGQETRIRRWRMGAAGRSRQVCGTCC